MTEKRKRGSLPKPEGQKQTERFVVRMMPGEAELFRSDVAAHNTTAGAFLTELWRQWRELRED